MVADNLKFVLEELERKIDNLRKDYVNIPEENITQVATA